MRHAAISLCLVFVIALLFYSVSVSCSDTFDSVDNRKQLLSALHAAVGRQGHKLRNDAYKQQFEDFTNVSLEELKQKYNVKTVPHISAELLSGRRQRSNEYTPTGSISRNGFKMTPLDEYVSRPDSHYQWTEMPTYYDEVVFDIHFLNLTSQKWLNEQLVSRSIWWHQVAVVRPLLYNHTKHAIMYITGTGNPSTPGAVPSVTDESLLLASLLAVESGSIAVVLFQIPNEHLEFYDEKPTPRSRSEDSIIAYTWMHFIGNPKDSDWLVRNPMTKGSLRAMDAVEEYVEKKWGNKIEKWVITGASKRGWTTWTLGAYDVAHEQRILAIMPMVMSFINWHGQAHTWWQSMGGWSFALKDYYELNFTAAFDRPETQLMADIIDPYTYFDRFALLPKMQIMATGDEFFQIHDPRQYWSQLPGEKHLLICQNAEHSLISSLLDLLPSLISYYRSFVDNIPRPQVKWEINYKTQTIRMQSNVKPSRVKIWFGKTYSTKRIDFRLITSQDPCPFPKIKDLCPQPILWFSTDAIQISNLEYEAHFSEPSDGWISYFIQMQFADQGAGTAIVPHIFTSEAIVVPDRFPFKDCVREGCKGELI